MFDIAIDTAIGLVLTFLLFSILLTIVMEIISGVMALRAKALENAVAKLIEDPSVAGSRVPGVAQIFGAHTAAATKGAAPAPLANTAAPFTLAFEHVYTHPLVAGDLGDKPSYVPGDNFASALTQVLGQVGGGAAFGNIQAAVGKLTNTELQTGLQTLLDEAGGDLAAFRTGVARWFDNAMDRLSGGYKRFTQVVTFVVGLLLAVGLNVDAIHVAQSLYSDPALRNSMVAAAQEKIAKGEGQTKASAQVKDVVTAEQTLAQVAPVGWSGEPNAYWSVDPRVLGDAATWAFTWDRLCAAIGGLFGTTFWFEVLGWLLTALAGLLGAPFWFDALSGLVNLRSAGPKPKSSTKAT